MINKLRCFFLSLIIFAIYPIPLLSAEEEFCGSPTEDDFFSSILDSQVNLSGKFACALSQTEHPAYWRYFFITNKIQGNQYSLSEVYETVKFFRNMLSLSSFVDSNAQQYQAYRDSLEKYLDLRLSQLEGCSDKVRSDLNELERLNGLIPNLSPKQSVRIGMLNMKCEYKSGNIKEALAKANAINKTYAFPTVVMRMSMIKAKFYAGLGDVKSMKAEINNAIKVCAEVDGCKKYIFYTLSDPEFDDYQKEIGLIKVDLYKSIFGKG